MCCGFKRLWFCLVHGTDLAIPPALVWLVVGFSVAYQGLLDDEISNGNKIP